MTFMRTATLVVLIALVVAVGTWLIGWPAVPAIALIAGIRARRYRTAPLLIGLGAMLGSTALLVLAAARGPVLDLAQRLGGVLQLPWLVVVGFTLLFPALLGWSAARVARGLTGDGAVGPQPGTADAS